jgi:hypothetical protein
LCGKKQKWNSLSVEEFSKHLFSDLNKNDAQKREKKGKKSMFIFSFSQIFEFSSNFLE